VGVRNALALGKMLPRRAPTNPVSGASRKQFLGRVGALAAGVAGVSSLAMPAVAEARCGHAHCHKWHYHCCSSCCNYFICDSHSAKYRVRYCYDSKKRPCYKQTQCYGCCPIVTTADSPKTTPAEPVNPNAREDFVLALTDDPHLPSIAEIVAKWGGHQGSVTSPATGKTYSVDLSQLQKTEGADDNPSRVEISFLTYLD
jgi:hypothetical protein